MTKWTKKTALGGLEISHIRIMVWGLPWQLLVPTTSLITKNICGPERALTSHLITKFVIPK